MALNSHALRFSAADKYRVSVDKITYKKKATGGGEPQTVTEPMPSISGLDRFFWEAWVKVGSGCTNTKQRVYTETQPDANKIRFSVAPTRSGGKSIIQFELAVTDGATPTAYKYTVPNGWDDRWHHIGFSANVGESTYSIYFDGNRVAAGKLVGGGEKTVNDKLQKIKIGQVNDESAATAPNRIDIGAYYDNGSYVYWDGKLDNIRLWNKATNNQTLSSSGDDAFNDQHSNPSKDVTDLLEEWRFNEGTNYFEITNDAGAATVTGTSGAGLRIRSSASLSASTVIIMPEGASVTITGDARSGWYPVSYSANGTTYTGWSSASYLTKSTSGSSGLSNTKTYGSKQTKEEGSDTEIRPRTKASLYRDNNPSSELWIGELSQDIVRNGKTIPKDYDRPFLGGGKLDTFSPSTPTNLQRLAVTDDSITVSWSPSWDDVYVQRYELSVATDLAFTQPVLGYSPLDVGTATTWSIDGLTPNRTYYWRVRAIDSSEQSNTSQWASSTAYRKFKKAQTSTRINYCLNPSFENGSDFWEGEADDGYAPSIQAKLYTNSDERPADSDASLFGQYYLNVDSYAIPSLKSGVRHQLDWKSGEQLSGSLWIRGDANIKLQWEALQDRKVISVNDLSFTYVDGVNSTQINNTKEINSTSWAEIKFEFTPSVNQMNRVGIKILNIGANDYYFDIDGVLIEKVPLTSLGSFFDGDHTSSNTAVTDWAIIDSSLSGWLGYIPKSATGIIDSRSIGRSASVLFQSAELKTLEVEAAPQGVTTITTIDRIPPGVPSIPAINQLLDGDRGIKSLNIKWNAPQSQNDDIVGYQIQLGFARGFATSSAVYVAGYEDYRIYSPALENGFLVHTATGLRPNTEYAYRIRAFDSNLNFSNWSAAVYLSTKEEIDVIAPTSVRMSQPTDIDHDHFVAAWSEAFDDVGVVKYLLDVATDNSFTVFAEGYASRDVGNVLSYQVTDLSPQKTYYVRARAVDAAGNISEPFTGEDGYVTVTTPARVGGEVDSEITLPVVLSANTASNQGLDNSLLSLGGEEQLLTYFPRSSVVGKISQATLRFVRRGMVNNDLRTSTYKFTFWPLESDKLPLIKTTAWPGINAFTYSATPAYVVNQQQIATSDEDIYEIDITPLLETISSESLYIGFRMRVDEVAPLFDVTAPYVSYNSGTKTISWNQGALNVGDSSLVGMSVEIGLVTGVVQSNTTTSLTVSEWTGGTPSSSGTFRVKRVTQFLPVQTATRFNCYGSTYTENTAKRPSIILSTLPDTALRIDSVITKPQVGRVSNLFVNPTLDSSYESIPINDGTFIEDVSKWWVSSASAAYSYSFEKDLLVQFDNNGGSARIEITANTNTGANDKTVYIENSTVIPVPATGITYSVKARVATSNGNLIPRVGIRWYSASGQYLGKTLESTSWNAGTNTWAQRTLTHTLGQNDFTSYPAYFKVCVYVESVSNGNTGSIYIDEVTVGTSATTLPIGVSTVGSNVLTEITKDQGYDIGPTTTPKSLRVRTSTVGSGVKFTATVPDDTEMEKALSNSTTNLVANPSFESNYGMIGDTYSSGEMIDLLGTAEISRNTSTAFYGSTSLLINYNTTNDGVIIKSVKLPIKAVDPWAKFVASFIVKGSGNYVARLGARLRGSSSISRWSNVMQFSANADWSRKTIFSISGSYNSYNSTTKTISWSGSTLVGSDLLGKRLRIGTVSGIISSYTSTSISVTSWSGGTPSSTGTWSVENINLVLEPLTNEDIEQVELHIYTLEAGTKQLWIDAVQIEDITTGAQPSPYCDGDADEYSQWWGVPHESISFRNAFVASCKVFCSSSPNLTGYLEARQLNGVIDWSRKVTLNMLDADSNGMWTTLKTWPLSATNGLNTVTTNRFVSVDFILITNRADTYTFNVDGVGIYFNNNAEVYFNGSSYFADWSGLAFASVSEHPDPHIEATVYYTGDVNNNAKIEGLLKLPETYNDFQRSAETHTQYFRTNRKSLVKFPSLIVWNELSNPSFETGVYGWVQPSDSLQLGLSDQALSGSAVGLWTVPESSQIVRVGELIKTAPGERWSFQVSLNINSFGSRFSGYLATNKPKVVVGLSFFSGEEGNVPLTPVTQNYELTLSSWTQGVVTAVAPAGATRVQAFISNDSIAVNGQLRSLLAPNDVIMLDQAMLYRGPLGRSYRDGDSGPHYFWEGRPHESRTILALQPRGTYDIKITGTDSDGTTYLGDSVIKQGTIIPANPRNFVEVLFENYQAVLDSTYIELRIPYSGDASKALITARYRRQDRYEWFPVDINVDEARLQLVLVTDGLRANTSYVFEIKVSGLSGQLRGDNEWTTILKTDVPRLLDTALADGTISYGGFLLNGPQSKYFWVSSQDSFSMPQRRMQIETLPRMDGGVELQSYWSTKTINITGGVWGETPAALFENLSALRSALAEKRQRLRIDTLTNRADYYIATCSEFSVTEQAGEARTGFEWNATFECADPFLYRAEPTVVSFDIVSALPAPQTNQLFTDDQTFTVNNLGTVDTLPTITIAGEDVPSEFSVVLFNDTTSDRIMPKSTISATTFNENSSIIINSETKQCTKNGGSIVLDYSGTFPKLAPGANNLRLSLVDLKQRRINLVKTPDAYAANNLDYDQTYDEVGGSGIYKTYELRGLDRTTKSGILLQQTSEGSATSGNAIAKITTDGGVSNQGIVFRTDLDLKTSQGWSPTIRKVFSGSVFARTDTTNKIVIVNAFLRVWYTDTTIQPTDGAVKRQQLSSTWNRIIMPPVTADLRDINFIELILEVEDRNDVAFYVDNVQIVESPNTISGGVAKFTMTVAYQERFI